MRLIVNILFQGLVIVLALIIAAFFAWDGLLLGAARLVPAEQVTPALDSDIRFISALTLGLCVTLIWLSRNARRAPILFHATVLTVVLGGLARLYSWQVAGAPPDWMKIAMGIEFGLPGVLIGLFWLREIGRSRSEQRPE